MLNDKEIKVRASQYFSAYKKGVTCPLCGITANTVLVKEDSYGGQEYIIVFALENAGAITEFTIDHIIPKCYGGTDHIDNLQAMCSPCNNKKGNTLDESIFGSRTLKREIQNESQSQA